MVVSNLCLGLDRLGVQYAVNVPFRHLRDDAALAVLGRGRYALRGYDRPNRIVAGIGLMTHPGEWPTLCDDYPVVRYLQHSAWTSAIYKPYFGSRCAIWPVGIDTEAWKPERAVRNIDVLLYDKLLWDRPAYEAALLQPLLALLQRRGLKFTVVRYGHYSEHEYRALLANTRSMIFLSPHESQGLAYQECLSSGVPILAWDQGWWLDPNRVKWGAPNVPATSVPYFDARCGETFDGFKEFELKLDDFLARLRGGSYDPRGFVLENLTLEARAQAFLEILRSDTCA
jgi:hypothetical protein